MILRELLRYLEVVARTSIKEFDNLLYVILIYLFVIVQEFTSYYASFKPKGNYRTKLEVYEVDFKA